MSQQWHTSNNEFINEICIHDQYLLGFRDPNVFRLLVLMIFYISADETDRGLSITISLLIICIVV